MSAATSLRVGLPDGERRSPRKDAPRPSGSNPPGWVPELHGLRGLALALVVLFHLFGQGRVSGGVDVFLVVSGFLATGALLRRAERRVLNPFAYWGRTFWRLAVPALLTLAATAGLMFWLMPRPAWEQTGREIFAAATYWVNWEMIAGQLAYGAAGPQTSPVQHFWSLSVQGQFFLLWPLVVLAVTALVGGGGRRRRLSPRRALAVVTALATAASFWFAVGITAQDQATAYFHSGARFWELGLGALAALVLPRVRVPVWLRPVLAWLGLAMVVACGFLIDGGSAFPGPWALWPVGATLLVVLGSSGVRPRSPGAEVAPERGPRRLLETGFLRWVADRSYALYLWHWPLLISYLLLRDRDAVGPAGGAVVLAASVAAAWLTDRTVVRGAQSFRGRVGDVRSLVATVLVISLVAVPVGLWVRDAEHYRAQVLTEQVLVVPVQPSTRYPGATVLTEGVEVDPAVPRPDVLVARQDWSEAQRTPGCVQVHGRVLPDGTEVIACPLHEPDSPALPDLLGVPDPPEVLRPPGAAGSPDGRIRTVALVGDSHTLQWSTAFQMLAEQEGWRLVLFAKHGCRMQDPDLEVSGARSCQVWNEGLGGELAELRPDVVVTVGTYTATQAGEPEKVAEPEVSAWRKLDAHGIPVIALRDNMRFETSPVHCVAEHGPDPRCGRDRAEILGANPLDHYRGLPASTTVIDLNDALCTPVRCEEVVGNVLVYRDDDHISATYVRTVAPYLDERLRAEVPWLYR
ncbi:acyltransferase family protein [Promicromonospora sp. NPDC050249]|uniref:acyltransferase family protein n=1 Tax=Promicromonospora sp. NPDC050249 TaxID=3154743 RepID=UPI0033FC8E42